MIKIKIPNNNINERKYIIDILFGEFLELRYKIEIGSQNYEIILENGNTLIIEDHFFNKFSNNLEYLKEEYIPKSIEFAKNDFIVEVDIPIIYGNNTIKINNQNTKTIICGIDIFASSFFMLTRWEEYVNKTRDKHNRFPAYASLAYKHNFLDKPVVNEYVEMLKNILLHLGLNQKLKTKNYQLILTHDVDHAYKYKSFNSMLKELAGDLIKRKSIKQFLNTVFYQTKFLLNKANDPFDTYDYLMDISEKAGVKSYFFLHSSNSAKQDVNNDKFLKQVSQKILKRGHYLGCHPSYNAYNDFELFIKDKERIENIIEQKLTFGRTHFLRFEIPTTWQIWEDANMEWDSACGYADKEGFRCGVCYPYSIFNILSRKKLLLKEKPLIMMEGSFVTYQDITLQEMENRIKSLMNTVKKYNGEFMLLWHNSSFNVDFWKKYTKVYENILVGCKNEI
jgi:hypothetical protein